MLSMMSDDLTSRVIAFLVILDECPNITSQAEDEVESGHIVNGVR